MKINDIRLVAAGAATSAATNSDSASVSSPAAPAADRITTDQAVGLKASVSAAVHMAAGERALRLQSLIQQVRSGTYQPNVSRLAEEILAQAEVEARLATSLH